MEQNLIDPKLIVSGAVLRTRSGKRACVLSTNREGTHYSVTALVLCEDGREEIVTFTKDGEVAEGWVSDHDLVGPWIEEGASMKIGSIRADNIEDPESLGSVKFGLVTGDGLIADIWRLVEEYYDAGYAAESEPERHLELRKQLYLKLRAIERQAKVDLGALRQFAVRFGEDAQECVEQLIQSV